MELEGRVAECLLFKGEVQAALRTATDALTRIASLDGVTVAAASLYRVQGYALMQAGDLTGARAALESSLQASEEREADFERAQTLMALVRLARLEGATDEKEQALSDEILQRLHVVAVPAVPLSVQSAS